MKKQILSMLLVIMMVVGLVAGFTVTASAAEVYASGNLGQGNRTAWTIYDNGLLVIDGKGNTMTSVNWDSTTASPWKNYADIITRVSFANCENWKSLPAHSFKSLYNLKEVTLPENLEVIQQLALGYTAIETIELPQSLTTIGEAAFSSCKSLNYVNIHNGITTIEARAFWDCDNLKAISIPDSVTLMRQEVFQGCDNLEYVRLGSGFPMISSSVFSGCNLLESLTIPANVTTLGVKFLSQTASLKGVYYQGNVVPTTYAPNGTSGTFYNMGKAVPIYTHTNYTSETIGIKSQYLNDVRTVTKIDGYFVNVAHTIGGAVKVDKGIVPVGDTVTVDIMAYKNYALDTFAVTGADGNEIIVTGDANTCTFAMPEGDVTITATFKSTIVPHVHSWTFEVDGTRINATCANSDGVCHNPNQSVVMTAPGTKYFAWNLERTVTVSGTIEDVEIPEVVYTLKSTGEEVRPFEPGVYVASLTIENTTLTCEYEITKSNQLNYSFFTYTAPANLTYDGTAKVATVVPNATVDAYIGEVEVLYNGNAMPPVNVGSYTVTFNVEESDYFTAKTSLTLGGRGGQKFSIVAKDIGDLPITGLAASYPVGATPDVTIQYNGMTLLKDTDYTIEYADNTASGTATMTITGKGNYTGTKELEFNISEHSHSWTYAANGDTLTATCGNEGCLSTNTELKINAPALTVYDGTESEKATLSATSIGDIATLPAIQYAQKNGENWTVLSGAPDVPGSYRACITVDTATASVEYTIDQATLTPSGTGIASGTYGAKMNELTVSGLTAMLNGTEVPGTWMLTGDTVPNVGDTESYTATFTPAANAAYYKPLTAQVTLNITPDQHAAPTAVVGSYAPNANKTAFVYTISEPTGNAYEYSTNGTDWQDSPIFAGFNTSDFDGFNAGDKALFYARVKADSNHTASYSAHTDEVEFTKLDQEAPALSYQVSGNSGNRTITITEVEGAEYSFDGGTTWGSSNVLTGINDETVSIAIRMKATAVYKASEKVSVSVNTAKQVQTVTFDTTDRTATYGDGTLEAREASAEGAITYESSDPTVATVDVNSGAVTVLKAGTVTITAKAAETADYASVQASYTLIVNPKEISAAMISLDQASYVYDSTEKRPMVTVTDGSQTLTETVDYTISGDTSGTNVNTYTITIRGMGNYTGTPSVQWSITRQPAQEAPTGLNSTAASAAGASDGKITGVNSSMEWSMDSSFATPNPIADGQTEITGLAAGTYYVRYKATSNTEASNYATVTVADGPSALQGTMTITGQPKFGEQLTAQVTGTNNSGTLSYQWKRGEDEIAGAQQPTYTLTQDDIGKVITCVVTSSVETGSLSASTVAIEKADGPAAPSGLTTTAPTTYGGSDGRISGVDSTMEYASSPDFADAQDCTGSAITGLEAGIYYVRVKETETTKAGLAAQISVSDGVSTLPVPTAKTGLKHTGSEQTGVAEGAGYTLTGHKATNAGSYTATATLAIGYKWSDGTTEDKRIAWEIGKADAPAAPTSLTTTAPTTHGGNDGAISGMNSTMEWSSDGVTYQHCTDGSITGLKAGTYYVRFKETENEKASIPATLVINEPVGSAPVISTASLPNGMVGTVYSQQLQANGTAPIEWILADGSSLPAGLTLSEEGLISGTPATAGTTSFTVQAKNAIGEAEIALTMTVDPVPVVPQVITVDITPSRTIIQGKASIMTLTIGKGLPDLSANNFASLTVDGQRIQRGSETFEVYTGSVIIQLHPAYLNTLPVGEHHIVIELQEGVYDGRSVETSIIVAPAEDANASSVPPKTGDSSHLIAWSMTMLIALFGVVSLIGKRKRA